MQSLPRPARQSRRCFKITAFTKATIANSTAVDTRDGQVDVRFHVVTGPQARIGDVKVEGDPGMPVETFRKKGKLKQGSKVSHDTVRRALTQI